MSLSNYKTFENWRKKNSPPITKDEWLPMCKHVQEVEEKYIQNEHLVDNIAEELAVILESSDSDMSEEDGDNSLEGILPLSPDSE
jgi:hypothetical protein